MREAGTVSVGDLRAVRGWCTGPETEYTAAGAEGSGRGRVDVGAEWERFVGIIGITGV
ncbi:hypothetical protein B005_1465 [Nocardiopsis alba ATCC BAA-2165]|jgi:hypothetical protein|uniref:Uncharacterized protein n=1 Tax=Nocardiopsis alba (strain ATCC BAA-2165 / BE74) TaxID=1205910 RepID=J7LGP3_NOCAA|nr:hypothetical protein B005_1465 [Nocardiopsis alba ATCC BAA-2165]